MCYSCQCSAGVCTDKKSDTSAAYHWTYQNEQINYFSKYVHGGGHGNSITSCLLDKNFSNQTVPGISSFGSCFLSECFLCVLNWLKLVSWHSCYDNVSVPLFLRDYLSVQRTNPSDLVLLGILWNEKLRLSDCCNTTILFLLVQINFLECIIVRLHMLQALSTEASRCWDTRYTCVIPCSISFALLCVNILQCSKVVHRPAMWDGFAS